MATAYKQFPLEQNYETRDELLDLATEAMVVRGLDGRIQFWNSGAEALYGWRREEVLGLDMHALLHTVFPAARTEIEASLRNHACWQGNLTQHTHAGEEITTACRITMNHAGNAILEVARDITAQLQAEQAMRESEKFAAMGRVAGIVVHEINNPLAALTNTLYLVRNHPSLDATARHFADLAEEELKRVSQIARQTLSFYRESTQPEPVNLPDLINEVLELQMRDLVFSHVQVRQRYLPTPAIMGFQAELRQVFLNLIGNAVQATPAGGTLGVYVREATEWSSKRRGTAISIVNTGAGIRREDVRRIFQPFFSTKAARGAGLGLWISRGIVEKYEGSLSCRSLKTSQACVTCFKVFLPANRMPRLVPLRQQEHAAAIA